MLVGGCGALTKKEGTNSAALTFKFENLDDGSSSWPISEQLVFSSIISYLLTGSAVLIFSLFMYPYPSVFN